MKVLYADLEREWRGGQSQALHTLLGLRNQGHQAELLAPQASPVAERAAEAGIKVHPVGRLALRIQAAFALRRLIENGNYDILHLNEPHALTSAWLAKCYRKVPMLLSRRIGFPLWKNRVSQARYATVDRFLASSETVAKSLIDSGIENRRISIVNEGVPVPPRCTEQERIKAREYWGIKDDEFLFGCVSVFVPEKGQRHLIEALPVVRAKYPRTRLLLPGDGACLPVVASLAKQLRQEDAVILPGFIRDVDQIYAALDAYAFPSEFEGLGTALLVAMAMGLPCISTSRGALREVVDHSRTALVCEPAGKEFADAMLQLIGDRSLQEKLGNSARREIEQRFSAERMAANTARVYEEVLKKRRTV
jgi:glycosyltransferase involved in cell wall biosynthesis